MVVSHVTDNQITTANAGHCPPITPRHSHSRLTLLQATAARWLVGAPRAVGARWS